MGLTVRTVVLVGMPGSGKTTLGRLLAARLSAAFLDTDELLIAREGKSLRALLGSGFAAAEEAAALSIPANWCGVVATGGSVVYSEPAMRHLKALGAVVHLHVSPVELGVRLGDLRERGVVIAPGLDLAGLYAERLPLYRRWADLELDGATVGVALDAMAGLVEGVRAQRQAAGAEMANSNSR